MATGALKRKLPTGGCANGMPSHLSVLFGAPAEMPRNVPDVIWTMGPLAAGAGDALTAATQQNARLSEK